MGFRQKSTEKSRFKKSRTEKNTENDHDIISTRAGSWMIFLAICLLTAPAVAEDRESEGEFIVVGAAELPEFEGADDGRAVPFFVGRLQVAGRELEVEGLRARYNVLDHPFWRAGPMLSLTLPRDEDFVDQPTVQNLDDIDLAFELGGFVGFRKGIGRTPEDNLSGALMVRRDVLDAHDGLLITAELEYFFKLSRMFRFGIGLNGTWADGSYHDTYFSIAPDDALRTGLPIFEADAGLKDLGVEVYNITSFSESWGIFTRLAYNRLLGDAADGPLVTELGSEDQVFVGFGVFRRW